MLFPSTLAWAASGPEACRLASRIRSSRGTRTLAAATLRRVLLGAFVLSGAAAAEPQLLGEAEHADWRAIGRVNIGGFDTRGNCTGTLVAPDLVLTAAHCVPARALRADRPEKVHFVAGWFRGEYAAHRTAIRVDLHPDWVRPQGVERSRADLALLTLETSIDPADVAPLPLAPMPGFADDLTIIGYSNRNTAALARSGPCSGLEVAEGVLGTTCAVQGGNSGAPVLRPGPAGWTVVAVAVARGPKEHAFASFAAEPDPDLFAAAGRPLP